MKVIVDWVGRFTSEVELLPSDLARIKKAGVSLEDGQAVAGWVKAQEWLADDAKDSIFQTNDFMVKDIEVQDDDGTVVF